MLGNVEDEHVDKWARITVLATCDKTTENKGKFNIKFKSVYFEVGEEGVRIGEKFTGRCQ